MRLSGPTFAEPAEFRALAEADAAGFSSSKSPSVWKSVFGAAERSEVLDFTQGLFQFSIASDSSHVLVIRDLDAEGKIAGFVIWERISTKAGEKAEKGVAEEGVKEVPGEKDVPKEEEKKAKMPQGLRWDIMKKYSEDGQDIKRAAGGQPDEYWRRSRMYA
jgi:hypothetical protein